MVHTPSASYKDGKSMLLRRNSSQTLDPRLGDSPRNGDHPGIDSAPPDAPLTIPHSHADVIRQLEPFVMTQLHWLRPVQSTWQPSDLLPNSSVAA